MNAHWSDIFGRDMKATEVVAEAVNSGISLPDWLHSAYIELYPNDHDHQHDFDKLAAQIEREAGTEA